ncbi:DUF4465 domain-containing protein [Prevotella sp. E2-28]|uniref:DUF4465 domain-containing protein n=1 Tax=Prevotella sp. E2-28 TaxID=2913620 RepID=UPI001EDA219C|nr:DUF4465 domain-containing protein [Prevotella sp. E2-28]UKK53284.1 DUF4465 domain-containing protein [Prevotella sp. E2-28]
MKKYLLSIIALALLAVSNAFATQVEVTMNAKSKLIKSLVNIATQEPVTVGEPTSNKYTFDAPDGSYLLTATAADGETVSGTIQLDIDADHTTFAIFSPEITVKNSGWEYGTDYTFDLKVTTKEGAVVNTTMGDYTTGKKMFLVFSGNTYYLDMIPSEARQAEGYLTASYTGTVTFNASVNAESPMSATYSITVPAGANLFLGTKTAHFVKFKEVTPESITEGGTVYNFKLADKQVYNYRVSQEGKYTHAGLFTMSVDETKRPELVFTDADMTAKDPKFIDHDVTSNSKYNVGDLFLNINPAGHLKLANVGDTYDILPMRTWQLIESITNNYFIEPDYHFTVVNLNGQEDNSVVKVENEQLTAVGTGTAIVLVTYDAIHLNQYSGATKKDFVGGADWGAIWPENTGVFVVTVGEQTSDIKPNIIINKDYLTTVTSGGKQVDTKMAMENVDAEFDVLYYLDTEDGFDYTFTPEGVASVTLARPTIGTNAASYTGFSAEGVTKNDDDSYTVHLTMGRNIVCLTDAAGKSTYQVMTVKPCHRDIMVNDEVVTSVKPGDAVTIQYTGLYHPANKLAGIHNFNAFLSYKKATDGITVKNGKGNQYTMAATPTAQAVTFTVPEDWTSPVIELSDGVMGIGGFGDPVGNHRATSKTTGRAPNFTAISQSASLGRVPAIEIPVKLSIATFEDVTDITEPVDGHMSVSTEDDDDREFFTSGDYAFSSGCMSDYDYWYWFGYANPKDTKFETLDDQWNNIVGGGYDGSATYGVAFAAEFNGPSEVTLLTEPAVVPGFYITNSSYAYTSMLNGDGFAKKFGKGDWFKLTITGYDANNDTTATKEYYLADLRDPNKAYIINDWRYVDLSGLGKVSKLGFELSSTDNGDYGMNTPAYFCFDNFGAEGEEVLPEKNVEFPLEVADFENLELAAESHMSVSTEDDDDRTEFTSGDFEFATGCMHDWAYWYWFGYANQTDTTYASLDDQWKNVVGGGYNGSKNYGVAYAAAFNGSCYVTVQNHSDGIVVPGFYITNSAYAYNSLTGGDSFAKKFGKGDWFKLTITGYDANNDTTATKEYYLADLRDPNKAYIINDWRYVDLSCLGKVSKLGFELSSSDNGDYGMNTPAYFCFDNFGAEGEEVLPEKNVELPLEVADFENLELAAESHMSVSTEDDDDRTEFTSGDFKFATGCMHDWASWWYFGYANQTDTNYTVLDDQWKNVVGGGYDGSKNYGVAYASSYYGPCTVSVLNHDSIAVPGFYITNSAYAYTSMLNGDAYSKQFTKGDWFKLTVTGYGAAGEVTGTKEYYLADLRDEATAYIINDWRYVDLSCLGKVSKLGFELSSSDNGDYGMNTPAYFCFDNFGAEGTEVLPEKNIATAITDFSVAKAQKSYYDLKGVNMGKMHKGMNIVRMPDGSVRKIFVK